MRRVHFAHILLAGFIAPTPPLAAQSEAYPTRFTAAAAQEPAVRDALAWLESNFTAHVDEWIRITEIPGTSRHEQERAVYVKAQLEAEGLSVTIDSIGNVLAVRPGVGGGETVVVAAPASGTPAPLAGPSRPTGGASAPTATASARPAPNPGAAPAEQPNVAPGPPSPPSAPSGPAPAPPPAPAPAPDPAPTGGGGCLDAGALDPVVGPVTGLVGVDVELDVRLGRC